MLPGEIEPDSPEHRREELDPGSVLEGTLNEAQVGWVVLDVQERTDRLGPIRHAHVLARDRQGGRWIDFPKLEPERAPGADRAVHADSAAHPPDERFRMGEAKPGPFDPGLFGADPLERLEQPDDQLRRNPRPIVADGDPQHPSRPCSALIVAVLPGGVYLIAFER